MRLDLPRLFRYDQWATRTLLEFMAAAPERPQRPRQLLAHVLGAQSVWLDRIDGRPPAAPVWPEWTLPQCAEQLKALAARAAALLAALDEAAAERVVAYTNSQGQAFTSTVGDILQHVLFHGVYHRGQIATHLRQAGLTPPATDFIFAVREGRLD